jgi:hypothetical protein
MCQFLLCWTTTLSLALLVKTQEEYKAVVFQSCSKKWFICLTLCSIGNSDIRQKGKSAWSSSDYDYHTITQGYIMDLCVQICYISSDTTNKETTLHNCMQELYIVKSHRKLKHHQTRHFGTCPMCWNDSTLNSYILQLHQFILLMDPKCRQYKH